MEYPKHTFCRYLNLPKVPDELIREIMNSYFDINEMAAASKIKKSFKTTLSGKEYPSYAWSDENNKKINEWCQKNICEDMYFAFQMIQADENGYFDMHRDYPVRQKLVYLIEPGGGTPMTTFYDEDRQTVLQSISIETHRWHVMDVSAWHEVTGLEPGTVRFAIASRLFPGG